MSSFGLTYHGKTVGACQWVIQQYEDSEYYADNNTIEAWVEECKDFLELADTHPELLSYRDSNTEPASNTTPAWPDWG